MQEEKNYNVPIFESYENVKDLKADLKASLDDMSRILGYRVPVCRDTEEAKKGNAHV